MLEVISGYVFCVVYICLVFYTAVFFIMKMAEVFVKTSSEGRYNPTWANRIMVSERHNEGEPVMWCGGVMVLSVIMLVINLIGTITLVSEQGYTVAQAGGAVMQKVYIGGTYLESLVLLGGALLGSFFGIRKMSKIHGMLDRLNKKVNS